MKNPSKKNNFYRNPIEQLRDHTPERGRQDQIIQPFVNEFVDQVLGRKKFSGEIIAGEQIEIKKVFNGQQAQIEKERTQLSLEKMLLEEERIFVERRSKELSVQIEAIQVQTTKLVEITPTLAREIQIAAFHAPSSVSIYELFFLEHLYKLIKSFTENIRNAQIWLHNANERARKKNVWGDNTQKYGARYFMSGEHYSGRSAA